MATKCPQCRRPHVEVELDVGGERLRMRSCSNCDKREWIGADGVVDLGSVLETVQANVGR